MTALANLNESYFHTVPEDEMPELPDMTAFPRMGGYRVDYKALFDSGLYAPVLSLTLLREHEGELQVLAGPRSETNGTHVDVVSVPTVRVSPLLARAAMTGSFVDKDTETPMRQVFRRKWHRFDWVDDMEAHPLGSMVSSGLVMKVGLADTLTRRTDEFPMSLESFTLGLSLVDANPDEGTKVIEAIGMLNAAVMVPADIETPQFVAYSALKWFPIDEFLDGYRRRDAVGMFSELGSKTVGMCVHGVCMATASEVLERGVTPPLLYNPK